MRIGVVGAGKLGLPFAVALDHAGHDVEITDVNLQIRERLEARTWPHVEARLPELLSNHSIEWAKTPQDIYADVVFVAVQTPHESKYDGTHVLDDDRADFDYQHLTDAIARIRAPIVAVISTVLPGTWKRLYRDVEHYAYTPSFVAMGTVIPDLWQAEFNLIGTKDWTAANILTELWSTLNLAPTVHTDPTTAEGVKMFYNSMISAKVALANTWGWLASELGMDVDVISETLTLAKRRLISGAYLRAGMGDGGACHPRDLIALSWLAREHGVYDLFGNMAHQREAHAEWLASLLPDGVVIFGESYKPDVNLNTGSASLLLTVFLNRQGKSYTIGEDPTPGDYNFIACAHSRYSLIRWPQGSTVIDPHGLVEDQDGVTVERLGR